MSDSLRLPCPTCSGTGTDTHEDRHTETNRDTCQTCGGTGAIPARTGESAEASFQTPGSAVDTSTEWPSMRLLEIVCRSLHDSADDEDPDALMHPEIRNGLRRPNMKRWEQWLTTAAPLLVHLHELGRVNLSSEEMAEISRHADGEFGPEIGPPAMVPQPFQQQQGKAPKTLALDAPPTGGDGGLRETLKLEIGKSLDETWDALGELWNSHCKDDTAYGLVTDACNGVEAIREALARPDPREQAAAGVGGVEDVARRIAEELGHDFDKLASINFGDGLTQGDFLRAARAALTQPNQTPEAAAPSGSAGGRAPKFWCMHVAGPDDVHAAPDFWTALAWAAELNTFIAQRAEAGGWADDDNWPLTQATVQPWPSTAETHARHLATELADRAAHKAKRAALDKAPTPKEPA